MFQHKSLEFIKFSAVGINYWSNARARTAVWFFLVGHNIPRCLFVRVASRKLTIYTLARLGRRDDVHFVLGRVQPIYNLFYSCHTGCAIIDIYDKVRSYAEFIGSIRYRRWWWLYCTLFWLGVISFAKCTLKMVLYRQIGAYTRYMKDNPQINCKNIYLDMSFFLLNTQLWVTK